MSQISKEERAKLILEKINQGSTLKEIGAELNLSRERIRQIAKDNGVIVREVRSVKREALEKEKAQQHALKEVEKQKRLLKVLELHQGGKRPWEIAKELNVHRETAYTLIKQLGIKISEHNKDERNQKIKDEYAAKTKTQRMIAQEYGLTITQVNNIIHEKKKPYDKNKYLNYKTRLRELSNTKRERKTK